MPTTPRVRRSITHTVPLGTKVVRPPPEMTAYRPSEVTAEPFGREGRTTSSASAGLVSGMRATSAPGSPARAFSRSTIETLLARKLGTTISFPFGVKEGMKGRVCPAGSLVPTRTRATSAFTVGSASAASIRSTSMMEIVLPSSAMRWLSRLAATM